MGHPFFLIDAFAHKPFTGNPAGVCLLQAEAEEAWMQSVAMEMNQAETAFVWPIGSEFGLRWFTPAIEVDLCGHATLASAHALLESGQISRGASVTFHTKSGQLICSVGEDDIQMDFPSKPATPSPVPDRLALVLGVNPVWFGTNRMDWFVELPSEDDVLGSSPDHQGIAALGLRGMVVTAPARKTSADFVSRFFAPGSGIPEDHVTGSAHCALAPYWAAKLGRNELTGYQASPRGGFVKVRVEGDRTVLSGRAKTVLQGTLTA